MESLSEGRLGYHAKYESDSLFLWSFQIQAIEIPSFYSLGGVQLSTLYNAPSLLYNQHAVRNKSHLVYKSSSHNYSVCAIRYLYVMSIFDL